jgi:UDP:flavonoid glycosyltransferase YjiC (YdhE family)
VPAHSRNPLPIAARLVARGHEVLWFSGRRFHDGIAAVGATPVPFAATRDYDGERLLEEFPELARRRGPRAIGWAYAELFVGDAPHRVADLEPVLAAVPVDAVLCDALSYGVTLLAESLDIPAATFGDGPLATAHGPTPAFGPGLLPMRGPVSRLRNHAVREATRRWVFAQAQERRDHLRRSMGLPPDGLEVLQAAVQRWGPAGPGRVAAGRTAAGQRTGQRVHPLRPAAATRRRVCDQRRRRRMGPTCSSAWPPPVPR